VQTDDKACVIQEYLGAEFTEAGRLRDIHDNPHLIANHPFAFDFVYNEDATQSFVYENTAKSAVLSVLEGYNATLLAYGQTGTGKTHTMEGFSYQASDPARGIIPRSMEEIFKFIEKGSSKNVI
jgi:chromosomal replication initiation ATPase DnaA